LKEEIVARLSSALQLFFKEIPRDYADYQNLLRSFNLPVRTVWFVKHQRGEFGSVKIYRYEEINHIYTTTSKVVAIAHWGWRVDTPTTPIVIMMGYLIDVLDKDIAEKEAQGRPPPAIRLDG
jgi:hypothetical protein